MHNRTDSKGDGYRGENTGDNFACFACIDIVESVKKRFVTHKRFDSGDTHRSAQEFEGELPAGAKVVVVEDLISTGGSSLKAVEALRQQGAEVLGMVASFTYGFPVAEQAFSEAHVVLTTLTDYEHVIEEARATGYIREEEVALLQQWRKDPAHWNV